MEMANWYILSPDGFEMAQIPGAEELVRAQLFDVLPVRTVRGEGEGGVVSDDFNGGGVLARREGEFVGFKEFPGQFRAGNDHARDGAEVELEYGTVAEGEVVEGVVDARAEEVEMADYGEGEGPWRGTGTAFEEEEEGGGEEEHGRDEGDLK